MLIDNKNIRFSTTTLHRTIGDFGYSFKIIRLIPESHNNIENINRMHKHARTFIFENEDVSFVDEFGIICSVGNGMVAVK